MYGPPESNPLGFWGNIGNADEYREHNPTNPNWMFIAPWQNSFLTWSLNHLVELGYTDAAKPRDFLLRWQIGMLTHPGEFDPNWSTLYHMAVGEQAKGRGGRLIIYDDWKKLYEENLKFTPKAKVGGEYAWALRGALIAGVDGNVPKAAEAVKVLESLMDRTKNIDLHWVFVPRPK